MPSLALTLRFMNLVTLRPICLFQNAGQLSAESYCTWQSAKKAGNLCHIADYYEKRKRSSETASHKKAAIASIHKLLRTIFALISCIVMT